MKLENLIPGDVVRFINQSEIIFLARLPGAFGDTYLFNVCLMFGPDKSHLLCDVVERKVTTFTMFQDAINILRDHGLIFNKDFEKIMPGMIVLDCKNAVCTIRTLAIVDLPRKMFFDSEGHIVDIQNTIICTGCSVSPEGLLNEKDLQSVMDMYKE